MMGFLFEEISADDFGIIIDEVIKQRKGVGECNKVTLVTHSSGSNSALIHPSIDSE